MNSPTITTKIPNKFSNELEIIELRNKMKELVERVAFLERKFLLCERCGSDNPNQSCKNGSCSVSNLFPKIVCKEK